MVKILFLSLFTTLFYANSFNLNCLSCHKDTKQLKLFMAKYTMKYSSEKEIKKAIFKFLKNPTSNKSIMPYRFIKKYGFKSKSILSNSELKKTINQYYKLYNIKQDIK